MIEVVADQPSKEARHADAMKNECMQKLTDLRHEFDSHLAGLLATEELIEFYLRQLVS